MAGTEKQGVNSGDIKLFEKAKWVLTPTSQTKPKALNLLKKILISMDCNICECSPQNHDKALSLISHSPIYLSSCLIETAYKNQEKSILDLAKQLASTGFADTSRIGGGNPKLGLDLAMNNKKNILETIKRYKKNINEIENLISTNNWELLYEKLSKSKEIRAKFL